MGLERNLRVEFPTVDSVGSPRKGAPLPNSSQGKPQDTRSAERLQFITSDGLQALLNASPDAVVVVDVDGRIVDMNRITQEMFGYTAQELVGQSVEVLLPQRSRAAHVQYRLQYLESPSPRPMGASLELTGVRRDETEFPVGISLSPLRGAEGVVVAAMVRDMTEQRRAQTEVVRAAGELQRSNYALEQFAYAASHDLQEPLRNISSCLQMIQKLSGDQLTEESGEFFQFAVDSAGRMRQMILKLLEFSRAGSSDGLRAPVSLLALVNQARENLTTAIAEAGAIIEIGDLPVILGNETQLVRLFQNLLSNSLKFRGDAAPRIRVGADPDGPMWALSVQDNGIGLDPKHSEKGFEIFQTLHPRSRYEGTGIGLAICRRIVEGHGGRIWAEPAEGNGTRICFTLYGSEDDAK